MKTPQIQKKKTSILFAGLIFFSILIFSTFLIDLYLLFQKRNNWYTEVTRFDNELGWDNIPNKTVTNGKITYTTNSLGFRSQEIDQSKQHILIIGDSVAFGVGVNDNETVSHYIQQKIPKYQVLNLAVAGYSIDQYYLKLKKHITKTNAKYIILIIFSGNDWFETIENNSRGISKPFFEIENGKLTTAVSKISLFSCSNYLISSLIFGRFNNKSLIRKVCNPQRHDESEGKKLMGILLKTIKILGNSVGAKTFFVLSPSKNDFFLQVCDASVFHCGANDGESNMRGHPEFF